MTGWIIEKICGSVRFYWDGRNWTNSVDQVHFWRYKKEAVQHAKDSIKGQNNADGWQVVKLHR